MATKIRLQRHGRKSRAIYHIVVADSRSKRDGKFIEKLGLYNPNHDPAKVELDFDSAVKWVATGAELSDTARSILSKEGVLLKNHLDGGVRKGALTEEEAEKKFQAWLEEKEGKINDKKENLSKAEQEAKDKALAAEKEVNAKREAAAAEAAAVTEEGEPEANVEKEVDEATAEEAKTEEKQG